jgi:hypothetical protein
MTDDKPKRRFVLCPVCGAKSRKLWSEMGGLQTRECQSGHRFEYDKWMADRIFWNPGAIGRLKKPLN